MGLIKAELEAVCPHCGYVIAGAQAIGHRLPAKGDFAVCWKCATILEFEEGLKLKVSRFEEYAASPIYAELVKLADSIRALRK